MERVAITSSETAVPNGASADPAGDRAARDAGLDRFGERMGEVFRHWRQEMDRRLRPLGLSFVQFSVLSALERSDGGIVQKDIAESLSMEGPSLVGVLDRMAAAKLIERREASHDRRAKLVVLRQDGRDLLAQAREQLRSLRRQMLDGLPLAQVREAELVLTHIAERLKR